MMTKEQREVATLMTDKLLTPKECATLANVSRGTIINLIYSGALKASKVGRQWRIRPEDLERYIKGDGDASV